MCFFSSVVQAYSNQSSSFPGPFDNNSNANKVDDAADPFSPRVRKFDPFEEEFSKPSSTFDFSFSKGNSLHFIFTRDHHCIKFDLSQKWFTNAYELIISMNNKNSQNLFVAFSEASKATKHQIFNGPMQVHHLF